MMRAIIKRGRAPAFVVVVALAVAALAAEPVRTAWILGSQSYPELDAGGKTTGATMPGLNAGGKTTGATSAGLSRILPDVRAVEVSEEYVVVSSAGISLRYLGPLQLPPIPHDTVRDLVFRIPRHPQPETGQHARVPSGINGVFVNGLPIYNQFETLSYNGANLWHYDPIAGNDNGTLTAAGHSRPELTHPAQPGLLEQLLADTGRHSPLIGFALDGYPVYGPWGFANSDGSGGLRRMRSSYRPRQILRRQVLPDGTQLMPEQYGPDVSAGDPLGRFAEDYQYLPGTGDLDECNGRFTTTPEFPNGTYAYFLTSDREGRLEYPYLVGPRFFGKAAPPDGERFFPIGRRGDGVFRRTTELSASEPALRAGHEVRLRFEAAGPRGERIRHFEYVHERPIHLLIASADLAEFHHIHPALTPQDRYEVAHTFAHGGHYRIWADFSLPGEAPRVESFDVSVEGPASALEAPASLTGPADSLRVDLVPSKPMRAGEDIPISLKLTGSTATLEPYLGAWAHVIVISQDLRSFTHVHPLEAAIDRAGGPGSVHSHAVSGPPPSEVDIVTSFPQPGLYKLWAQFQESGKVLTVPFVLRVESAAPSTGSPAEVKVELAEDTVRIRVTQHGYDPARLQIPANVSVNLAFTRESNPNCGSAVVFPSLGIRRDLRLGETVLVRLPPQPAGEIAFSCGMGMYRGMMVAR